MWVNHLQRTPALTLKDLRKIIFVVSVVVLVGSLYCGLVGIVSSHRLEFYTDRLVSLEEILDTAMTSPADLPEMIAELRSEIANLRSEITFFQSAFIVLAVVGCVLLIACIKVKSRKQALMILFLLLTLSLPTIQAQPTPFNEEDAGNPFGSGEIGKWHADLYLQQPRNSPGISGIIYGYQNILDPNYLNSFVAFRLVLIRLDRNFKEMEWVEIGYFENTTAATVSYFVYAAYFTLSEGYVVNAWLQIQPPNGNQYGKFAIAQISANRFIAQIESCNFTPASVSVEGIPVDPPDPPSGSHTLIDMTFTISGENLYHAGSESNNNANTLTCYYSGLKFYDAVWHAWSDVSVKCDPPYMVQLGSTDTFYTFRE